MTECYFYGRVSGKSQVEGDGFPRQRAAVEAWASLNGVDVVGEFLEQGVTGDAEWGQRPAFSEMLSRIFSNGVKTIVVENLTRLARSFVVQDTILTYLAAKGVTLISADTGADVTADIQQDPMKRALVQMQAVFSELEKNALVLKLRAARQRKGSKEGRKPFGFREGETAVLERMRALHEAGFSYYGVARELNEEGLPSRSGKPWAQGTVMQILKRDFACKKATA